VRERKLLVNIIMCSFQWQAADDDKRQTSCKRDSLSRAQLNTINLLCVRRKYTFYFALHFAAHYYQGQNTIAERAFLTRKSGGSLSITRTTQSQQTLLQLQIWIIHLPHRVCARACAPNACAKMNSPGLISIAKQQNSTRTEYFSI
jgi:hypothetical protein